MESSIEELFRYEGQDLFQSLTGFKKQALKYLHDDMETVATGQPHQEIRDMFRRLILYRIGLNTDSNK